MAQVINSLVVCRWGFLLGGVLPLVLLGNAAVSRGERVRRLGYAWGRQAESAVLAVSAASTTAVGVSWCVSWCVS
jgi:hypothetical protein